MADKVLKIMVVVLAVVLVVGVLTFAGPCVHDDGTAGMCQQSQFGIIGAGIVAALAAVGSLATKNKVACAVFLFLAALAGLFAALAPGNVLQLCMMATMHCRLVMQPFAQFVGIALAAIAVIAGIRVVRSKA